MNIMKDKGDVLGVVICVWIIIMIISPRGV